MGSPRPLVFRFRSGVRKGDSENLMLCNIGGRSWGFECRIEEDGVRSSGSL
jgi:hypothetical protein